MKLLCLGTGAADWDPKQASAEASFRRLTAAMVNRDLMIDCGPCVYEFAETFGYDGLYRSVTSILVTHSHGDHFNAECFADLEMSVIAGARAKEFYFFALRPRLHAGNSTEKHCTRNRVEHQFKACVTAEEYVVKFNAAKLCEELACSGNTDSQAVVTHIHAESVGAIFARAEHCEKTVGKVKLLFGGLAARHIKGKSLCFYLFIYRKELAVFKSKLGTCHLGNGFVHKC